MSVKIGVLALQGAFREHVRMLKRCGIEAEEVRLPSQLDDLSGLVIPGGESTTMVKLLRRYGFEAPLEHFASSGRPLFGTCAGAILLAAGQDGCKKTLFPHVDIDITRNAYGRQIESREAEVELSFSKDPPFNAIFIRAPIINATGPSVEALSFYRGRVVLARDAAILVATFHPELTEDDRIHRYFISMVKNAQVNDAVFSIMPEPRQAAYVK